MKETTLKEIAEQLGISVTTVSKALKGYPDVSPKTRKAVMELAEKWHYQPNSFAVNLRTRESRTIGLIIPEVAHHFFSNVIDGIIGQAEQHGYLVIILQSNESLELEKKQVALLMQKRVDGILMSLSNESNDDDHLREIVARGIPFVQFDKISKLIPSSKVIIDDRAAAASAVQHLIDKGCRRIAHIRGPVNPQNAIDRFMGYKKALQDNGIAFDPSLVYTCERVTFEEGRAFAARIVDEHPDVDGLFAITDLVAVGALDLFNERKVAVPERIAVIGFSNWFMSQVINPSLSSIEQPGREIGEAAFGLLLEEMTAAREQTRPQPRTVSFPTRVVERKSTQRN